MVAGASRVAYNNDTSNLRAMHYSGPTEALGVDMTVMIVCS